MAKKKNTKKPVSKRTTRATLDERNERLGKPVSKRTTPDTLDERNERLGKTDAPKPRAQKPEVVVTTEPAINTVWREGTAEEFLGDTQTTPPPAEYTKVNKNFIDSAWEWINFKLDDAKVYWKKHDPITVITDFAFAHPLIFGIGFCTALGAASVGVALLAQYFKW